MELIESPLESLYFSARYKHTRSWRRRFGSRLVGNVESSQLKRNSTFLMGSQTVNAWLAFVFWVLAAHLFTTTEVGQGAAIVSFSALVANFSNLGLPSTLLRFLPLSPSRGGLYSACILFLVVTGT